MHTLLIAYFSAESCHDSATKGPNMLAIPGHLNQRFLDAPVSGLV